jgi:hypothetical protein
MSVPSTTQVQSHPWQINTGAEGIAAAQFARCGFDVSLQYGTNKPTYDMVVTKGSNLLKVEVRGSQDGTWSLTQSYIKRAAEMSGKKTDFHGAIELWLDHYGARTICCLVQFLGVALDQLPRIYLATPREVATRLRETAAGRGDSVLYEGYKWASPSHGEKTNEALPESWAFSPRRVEEMFAGPEAAARVVPMHSRGASTPQVWSSLDSLSLAAQTGIAQSA